MFRSCKERRQRRKKRLEDIETAIEQMANKENLLDPELRERAMVILHEIEKRKRRRKALWVLVAVIWILLCIGAGFVIHLMITDDYSEKPETNKTTLEFHG